MACDEEVNFLAFHCSPAVDSYSWKMLGVDGSFDSLAETDPAADNCLRSMRAFAAHVRAVRSDIKDQIEDIPVVSRVDIRDTLTLNDDVPLKTPPEHIESMSEWIAKYAREKLPVAMFFNEVSISEANKQAVNRLVDRWLKMGG